MNLSQDIFLRFSSLLPFDISVTGNLKAEELTFLFKVYFRRVLIFNSCIWSTKLCLISVGTSSHFIISSIAPTAVLQSVCANAFLMIHQYPWRIVQHWMLWYLWGEHHLTPSEVVQQLEITYSCCLDTFEFFVGTSWWSRQMIGQIFPSASVLFWF